jgi:hypothetical protein
VYHLLEDSRFKPSPHLLVNSLPRRKIVWHIAPGRAGSDYPPEPIEDLPQLMVALRGVFSNEGQIRGEEGPLFVGNVAWVRFSVRHAKMLPFPSQSS